MEGKSGSLRWFSGTQLQNHNVLNHPWPADPIGLGTVGQPTGTVSNFSANNFGQIVAKGGTNNGFPDSSRRS
jgi:hypothetical protein